MAYTVMTKMKMLALWEILQQDTDQEHPIPRALCLQRGGSDIIRWQFYGLFLFCYPAVRNGINRASNC